MAPVPEDNNQDKPPNGNRDDSEITHFSNPNLAVPLEVSDSSDDGDNDSDFGTPNGYSLLPQEPGGEYDDDDDEDSDEDHGHISENVGDSSNQTIEPLPNETVEGNSDSFNTLPEAVLASEAVSAAPTVSASPESCHPDFLAKFPDGKIPSYMQVPSIPKDKDGILWNQERHQESHVAIDTGKESTILKAMSRISLPTENIPEWAKHLSNDQWQQQILSRIGTTSYKGKKSADTKSSKYSSQTRPKENTEVTEESNDWVATFPENDN